MTVLHVWRERQHIGVFTSIDRIVTFSYDEDAPQSPLSLSLPRDGGWNKSAPLHFLDNLLPDNPCTRRRIAHDTGAVSHSIFDLLARLGEDLAGALVLTPDESEPNWVVSQPLRQLTDDDIAYRISELRRDPDRWIDPDMGGRFSLAGAQAKFTMVRLADQWFSSNAALPSTHIVKPASPHVPDADVIEMASMRLAVAVGLPVPQTGLIKVLDQQAYIVERFDRDSGQWPPVRIHTEDLAQSMGLPPDQKYAVTARQIIELLHRIDPTDGLSYDFITRLAFNTSIDNADAHAKNCSVFLRSSGVSLTPVYDAVTTTYWPSSDTRLAMRIAGADRATEVTKAHWAKLARTTDLDEDRVVDIAASMAQHVIESLDQVFAGLPAQIRERLTLILTHANANMVVR